MPLVKMLKRVMFPILTDAGVTNTLWELLDASFEGQRDVFHWKAILLYMPNVIVDWKSRCNGRWLLKQPAIKLGTRIRQEDVSKTWAVIRNRQFSVRFFELWTIAAAECMSFHVQLNNLQRCPCIFTCRKVQFWFSSLKTIPYSFSLTVWYI